ncbi:MULTISPECIES: hypothetical protein [Micromonospora]|nr:MULTISPECIES: hypothetical protein [unclassified Micromonospora]MBM0228286.1 hypothetical protein [Micromonospora sp. ATA51]PWR11875.1 hypothetical protein DKT69_25615 [Micromonospora sp. 4G51]
MISEKVSVVKDKNYDLIHTIQLSLEHVWRMETYIADAEERGDSELATWFRKMQENNRKAADQGKKMLMERMQKENG